MLPQIGEPVYLQRETERGYCGVLSANGLLCWVPRWTLQPISPPTPPDTPPSPPAPEDEAPPPPPGTEQMWAGPGEGELLPPGSAGGDDDLSHQINAETYTSLYNERATYERYKGAGSQDTEQAQPNGGSQLTEPSQQNGSQAIELYE